jgi:hypothetical protein
MPRLSSARAHPHEGDPVAVVGVHIGLDLEHEGGHFGIGRLHRADVGHLRARLRRVLAQRIDQVAHAVIPQRRAEIDRRQMALAKRVRGRTACRLPPQALVSSMKVSRSFSGSSPATLHPIPAR